MHGLRHGYNLADLHDIARHAVVTDRSHHASDHLDRYQLAWSAIAEHLYTVEQPPTRRDLLHHARYALHTATQDDQRHHGMSHHTNDTAVNAARYWTLRQVTPSHEDRIIDSHALWQIWSCLRDTDRRALLALAAHEDYTRAADALGMKYFTFCRAVRQARIRFLALWHDGEQPSTLWGRDRRAAPGGAPASNALTPTRQLHRRTRNAA